MIQLEINHLTYNYPGSEIPALDNVNLQIQAGDFILITGKSGSGKSTLLRVLAGLIPDFYGGRLKGSVRLDNTALPDLKRRQLASKIGILFPNPDSQLVMNRVERELVFGMENMGVNPSLIRRRLVETTSALGLTEYLQRPVAELSGGEKQKVALAGTLITQPDILLLDEPMAQLDPVAAEEILSIIRRLNEETGITIIMAEQRLDRSWHIADAIVVMEAGKIVRQEKSPARLAKWAITNNPALLPPLAQVFAGERWPEIPVTVKEGRRILKSLGTWAGAKMEVIRPVEVCPTGPPILDIDRANYTYPGGGQALIDISLKVWPGDFIAIMGDNGAGKSTLLKLMNGLYRPTRGRVMVNHIDTRRAGVEELAPIAGYLSQHPGDHLFLPSVREEVTWAVKGDPGRESRVQPWLKAFNLLDKADRNPRDLSTGEQQRVVLASILVSEPKLLLLDEPTRGLDYQLKHELGVMLEDLARRGTAVVMVSHDVDFVAEHASRVIWMSRGRLVDEGSKYNVLGGSNFYSPQVGRLFSHIASQVITVEQGRQVLRRIINSSSEKRGFQEIL